MRVPLCMKSCLQVVADPTIVMARNTTSKSISHPSYGQLQPYRKLKRKHQNQHQNHWHFGLHHLPVAFPMFPMGLSLRRALPVSSCASCRLAAAFCAAKVKASVGALSLVEWLELNCDVLMSCWRIWWNGYGMILVFWVTTPSNKRYVCWCL